jgi:hypothetical protein
MTRMPLTDSDLDTWKAFINAHDRITRQINADLSAADLPDLTVYDALWALRTGDGGRRRMGELAEAWCSAARRSSAWSIVSRPPVSPPRARSGGPPRLLRGHHHRGQGDAQAHVAIYSAGIERLFATHATKAMGNGAGSDGPRLRGVDTPTPKDTSPPHSRRACLRATLRIMRPNTFRRPCRALVRGQPQEGDSSGGSRS